MKTAAICMVVSLLASILEKDTPQMRLLLVLAASAAVMTFAMSFYRDVKAMVDLLLSAAGLDGSLFLPVVKIIAISLIARVAGDICKDSDQATLASLVDISGTVCALLAARPLLERVLAVLPKLGG